MIEKLKKMLKKQFTKQYWQSEHSSNWHEKRKNEAYNDFQSFADSVSEQFNGISFDKVIELGTGAGTLIYLLSQQRINSQSFIGLDINKKQINENILKYKEVKSLEFLYTDIESYMQTIKEKNVMIIAQNTLDYFSQNQLENLLLDIYTNIANIVLVTNGSNFNGEITESTVKQNADLKVYQHNYLYIFEKIGFKVLQKNINSDNTMIIGYKGNQFEK